jgi:AraC family transcriptional regulator
MADAGPGRVREADTPFAKRTSKPEFFRDVGARLIQKKELSGSAVTIERIERRGAGTVDWRFRQDRDALFYFEQGIVACQGVLDGERVSRQLNGATRLAFVEAGSTVETLVDVPGRCSYWVAFIDRERLLGKEDSFGRRGLASRIGFDSASVALSVSSLKTELMRCDELSNMFIESWAIQALILLHRSIDELPQQSGARLSKGQVATVIEFMSANMEQNITLDCVAKSVGLSARHLRRLFRASTGIGPSEMFANMRLEKAAHDLRHSRKHITDISMDCGFTQPQHLATAFRRKFGLTPTEYRQKAAS